MDQVEERYCVDCQYYRLNPQYRYKKSNYPPEALVGEDSIEHQCWAFSSLVTGMKIASNAYDERQFSGRCRTTAEKFAPKLAKEDY
jgi:hypothetical protein